MLHQIKNRISKSKYAKYFVFDRQRIVFGLLLFLMNSGCSAPSQEAIITRRNNPVYVPVFVNAKFNADLVGITPGVLPTSTQLVLSNHNVSGNMLRTTSTSASFRVTAGVGVP